MEAAHQGLMDRVTCPGPGRPGPGAQRPASGSGLPRCIGTWWPGWTSTRSRQVRLTHLFGQLSQRRGPRRRRRGTTAELGVPAFGGDLSPKMIRLARHAYPNLRFTVATGTRGISSTFNS